MTRRAVGRLLRTPGVTLFSVAAIAVAIAASTAVYATIRGLLTPPGAERFERVANVYPAPNFGRGSAFSLEQVERLRGSQRSFAHLAIWTRVRAQLAVDRVGRDAICEAVTPDYFDVLDVRPTLGRLFETSDDLAAAPPVVVISHDLWRQRFNRDPAVVGRSLALNGRVFEIVGVGPEWFKGVDMPAVVATEVWIPLTKRPFVSPLPSGRRGLQVKGLLKPGVAFTEAAAEVRTIGQAVEAADPQDPNERRPRGWSVVPANDIRMHESIDSIADQFAFSALTATLLVLLVVSTNLANVQLARMALRRQELAVKTALGASRGRLVAEELTEVLLVAIAGLSLGVALAHALNTAAIPALLASTSLRISPAPVVGAPLVFAFAATLVVLAVSALVPAVHVTSLSPRATMANEDSEVSTPRWRGRRVLIVAQVAVAVMLVNIAGLAAVQLIPRLASSQPPRLTVVGLQRLTEQHPPAFDSGALEDVLRLAPSAGFGAVAISTALPAESGGETVRFVTPDGSAATSIPLIAVAGPLFEMSNMQMLAGRALQFRDTRRSEPVVVLSESAARQLFGSLHVAGRLISMERDPLSPAPSRELRTVIGVVADVASRDRFYRGIAYVPLDQASATSVLLVASRAGHALQAEELLEGLAMRAFPDVVVSRSGFGGLNRGLDVRFEVLGALTGSLGLTTVIVAMGGLFGLLSHLVTVRRKELGVRMALGATKGRLLAMVLRQGLTPVALGIVLGLGGGLLLQKGVQPFFLTATTFSWWLLGILPIAFLTVAAVAAYLPARRAASVEVTVALRQL